MKLLQYLQEKTTITFDEVEHSKPITIRCYHGTNSSYYIKKEGFRLPKSEINPLVPTIQNKFTKRDPEDREGFLGRGIYFTDSKKIASNYGTPLEVEVKLNKPYVIHTGDIYTMRQLDLKKLKEEGYDGIVVCRGRYGFYGESYRQGIVFDPSKIKVVYDKFKPVEIQKGAKVVHKETGMVGKVKEIRLLNDIHKSFHNDNTNAFVVVKWNKGGVEYNVKDIDLILKENYPDKFVNEKYIDSLVYRGKHYEVYENPSYLELGLLAKGEEDGCLRFIVDLKNKDFYVWSADVIHALALRSKLYNQFGTNIVGELKKQLILYGYGWYKNGKLTNIQTDSLSEYVGIYKQLQEIDDSWSTKYFREPLSKSIISLLEKYYPRDIEAGLDVAFYSKKKW
jgi:hypothetical protein